MNQNESKSEIALKSTVAFAMVASLVCIAFWIVLMVVWLHRMDVRLVHEDATTSQQGPQSFK